MLSLPNALVTLVDFDLELTDQSLPMRTFVQTNALRSLFAAAGLLGCAWLCTAADPPEPRVINPGPPPSDAIVLFDGKDLPKWRAENGGEPRWKI